MTTPPLFPWPVIGLPLLAAFGLYLLIRPGGRHEGTVGGWLAGASALALILFLTAGEFPESRGASPGLARGLFWMAGFALLAAAVRLIHTNDSRRRMQALVVLIAATAAVALLADAALVAAALLLGAAAMSAPLRWIAASGRGATHGAATLEPFLACAAGGLFAVALLGVTRYAFKIEAARPSSSLRHSARPAPERVQRLLGRQSSGTTDASPAEPADLPGALFGTHRALAPLAGGLLFLALVGARLIVAESPTTNTRSVNDHPPPDKAPETPS